MSERSRELTVSGLARVEGEGALRITVHDGQVTRAELNIYEPPRFFEAFLRGRSYTEPPDLTARICGICPVAYQTSACNAIEQACGAELTEPLAELRRLLYCGEWISSHALHIYLLHAPDFLGYPDAISLARDHRDIVERGLELKKTGQRHPRTGRRPRHPPGQRPGRRVLPGAGTGRAAARWPSGCAGPWTWPWTRSAGPPPSSSPTSSWSMTCSPPAIAGRYPLERGSLATTSGLSFPAREFPGHVTEEQVPHSTALHATLDGHRYLTGPLARYSLNSAALSPAARRPRPAPGWARSAATRSAASWCAASRSSTPSRRRCGSSAPTSGRAVRPSRWRRAPGPGTGSARPPGACCTTAMSWTATA